MGRWLRAEDIEVMYGIPKPVLEHLKERGYLDYFPGTYREYYKPNGRFIFIYDEDKFDKTLDKLHLLHPPRRYERD